MIAQGVNKDKIFVQSADGDEQKQVTQSENLITQGIDIAIHTSVNYNVIAFKFF